MTDKTREESKGVKISKSHVWFLNANPFKKKIGNNSVVCRNNANNNKHFAMNFGFAGLLALNNTARPIVISVQCININAIMYISKRIGRMD